MGTLLGVPLIYLVHNLISLTNLDIWSKRFFPLLLGSIKLVTAVCIGSGLIGFFLAWTQKKLDLGAKPFFHLLFVLPLTIPTYVGALVYIQFASPRGLAYDFLGIWPIKIYGFWGTAFVLTLFTFPYVYLFLRNGIEQIKPSIEEAHFIQNGSFWRLIRNIHFPLIKNYLLGALLLIALYTLADFGAIALLRYNTFTTAIYYQIESYEHQKASFLCFFLILISGIILYLKKRSNQVINQNCSGEGTYSIKVYKAGKLAPLIYSIYGLIIFFSVGVPLIVLIYWVGELNLENMTSPLLRSVFISLGAAAICILLSGPFSYYLERTRSKRFKIINSTFLLIYGLPSIIVAISVIILFNNYVPSLYQGIIPLLIAFVIRFVPQGIEMFSSQMKFFPKSYEEAHSTLNASSWVKLKKLFIPILSPAGATTLLLVFVSCLKELPLALLLRPAGFELLSTRIWLEANDAFYEQAAPYCLLLLLAGIISLPLIINKKEQML